MHIVYLLIAIDIFLAVVAQVALRMGSTNLTGAGLSLVLEPFKNPYIFMGLFLYAVSFFLYIVILEKFPLSIIYPVITGGILIFVTISSYLFLKETLTLTHILGIFAILSGIILVSLR